jgi:NADP-dependent 3-hydroxy acid dehydrogenase YdfG
MVNIKEIRSSNARLKDQPAGLIAVFAGATSGCGKGALEAFARYANAPTAYIIGRSKSASTPLLEKLASLNPQGTFNFIETEISLIRNVDKVCDEIKSKEKKIDFMSLSPGYLTFAGRQGNIMIHLSGNMQAYNTQKPWRASTHYSPSTSMLVCV